MPQDRSGRFSTELFERYQRSEQALVSTLAEMYVQGVSTRKVKAITEELCGHAFSASAISAINKRLDESLKAFAKRLLPEPFPYLVLDARNEKVREAGVVRSQAVLIAIGIDWDGRRQVLAAEMPITRASRHGRTSCLACRREAFTALSLLSPTIMPACAPPFAKCSTQLPISAATCISSGMRSIICRARPTTTACRNYAGSTTAGISPRHVPSRPVAGKMAGQVSQAYRLGRANHRGDTDLLSAASPAPQAHEVDQYAGTLQ